jgi:tetratricopeptide (TPR) repeat protein
MKAEGGGGSVTQLPASILLVALLAPVCWSAAQRADSSSALSADPRFNHGHQLVEQGRFSEAAAEFSELQKSFPDSPLLFNLLGFCNLQQGFHDQAIQDFQKAIALQPGFKPAHSNLGGIYLLQGRARDAIGEFQEVVRIDPKDSQAYFNLARAELAANDHRSGLEHLNKAYGLAPSNTPIAMALAQLDLKEGELEAGRPIAEKLRAVRAPDAQAEIQLGDLLLGYGLEQAALEHFRNAQRTDARSADILLALAADHFKRQNYKAALLLLGSLEPSQQNSFAWHELAGESAFKLGDPARAVSELQRAMELDPRNESCVLELGEVFLTENSPAAAATLFETAAKIFPAAPRVWFGLGVAYLAEVHYSSAEAALRRSLQLDPGLDLAYVVLARGYSEAGDWERLRETAQRLIEVKPQSYAGYYYQALVGLRGLPASVSTDREAERLLRRAVELSDGEPEPNYELAKLLAKEGRKNAARFELESIVRQHPDFGPAHYQLSRLYRETGELAKSAEQLKTFDRISAEERLRTMTRMLVEVHQRSTP